MPLLPAVGPWSGVNAVSPSMSAIVPTSMAQIDLAAVERDAAVGVHGEKPVDVVHIERLPERAIGAGDNLRDAGCRRRKADDERAARLEKFAPRNRSSHAFVSLPFIFARITARRMR